MMDGTALHVTANDPVLHWFHGAVDVPAQRQPQLETQIAHFQLFLPNEELDLQLNVRKSS